jgi:uncharacterized membrane protein
MYELPSDERPGCRETLILTRAAFSVLIPILLAMIAILVLVMSILFLLLSRPVLAIIPAAILVVAIVLFSRWDSRRNPPPEA